jgi:type I restriction enzyme R subunit
MQVLSAACHQSIEANWKKVKSIIWHTQGRKTALAYYNVKYLTDYFQSKKVIPKFYSLSIDWDTKQVKNLKVEVCEVHNVNSREEFAKILNLP